jgi:protein SCO1/2/putative membrane protein
VNRVSLILTFALIVLLNAPVVATGPAPSVASFSLTERNSDTVTNADLQGKVWVAAFVITRCPDGKCPAVTRTMQQLQKDFAKYPDVRLVTFTADPKRDTLEDLKRYADAHEADPQRWLFLTGEEETIDQLQRSFYLRAGERKPDDTTHSTRLLVIDRNGLLSASYIGLVRDVADTAAQEDFAKDMRQLKRLVAKLSQPELPGWMPSDFPMFNAILNSISFCLVFLGWVAIRVRLIRVHITCMVIAIIVSAVFLSSYLFYHLVVKGGEPTRFADAAPTAPAWVGTLYLLILGSHTILAIPAAPLILYTAYQGMRNRIASHVWIARWVLPIWLYVSVTGVVVYVMLYRLYAES